MAWHGHMPTALLFSADRCSHFLLSPHLPRHAFFFVEAKLCSVNHGRPGVCRKWHVASKHLHADLALKAAVCCEARFRDAPRAVQTVANGGGEA